MKKTTLTIFILTIFFGLTALEVNAAEVIYKTETVEIQGIQLEIVKTADNFIILYDSSGSMGEVLGNTGKRKIDVEKEILQQRNQNFPGLKINAGLYTFTPGAGHISGKVLKEYYPIQPYNKAEFAKAIDQLPTRASGATFIQPALKELDPILGSLSGRTVVFLVSDGSYTRWGGEISTPLEIAKELAGKHDVCFNVISNAKDAAQKALVKNIASINACSRVISFEDFLENNEYQSGALFVINEQVFKILFTKDKVVGFATKNILFDYNASEMKPGFSYELDELGRFLQLHPNALVTLVGHTDNTGSEEYNLGLSRKRAETVADYLMKNFNIDGDRITVFWYGEADPVYNNDTEEGRQKNRRVVSLVSGLE